MDRSPPQAVVHRTSISQKVQSRNAALQVRNGSPVLRELLRNKCRGRVKEHRYNFFNKLRKISEEDQKEEINSIIREEISEMDLDLQLQELIYKEIQQEAEQWLISLVEEFEQEDNYMIQMIEESNDEVFCPICQKSALQKVDAELRCPCGLKLSYSRPLTELYSVLWDRINEHGNVCNSTLTFFSEPKPDLGLFSLYATCSICDYLAKIVD